MAIVNDLGDFLRARRGEITPVAAGIIENGERRVPGLRREEVALLAGVSTDYYTRLEQGRERHPSDQVLDALARVLRLDETAVSYVSGLAQPPPRSATRESSPVVRSSLLDFLVETVAAPATLTGPALDVLAANALARALYGSFARFDNLVRMVFLDPAAREFYCDWDTAARGVVGELTMRSPAFLHYWSRREVRPRTNENKHLRHDRVGDLHLRYQAFDVCDEPGQQMYAYTAPAGSPSADALTLLGRLAPIPRVRDATGRSDDSDNT